MPKSRQASKRLEKDRYWSGIFTGIFIGCFFVSALFIAVIRFQGLQVTVNPEKLASLIQAKVKLEVKKDLPQVLESFKKELPQEIGNHLDGLEDLKIGFGNSQVKLPQEVIIAIRTELNRIIETAIMNTLNDYNISKYEDKISENVHDLILSLVKQDIIGKTYLIQTTKWFVVPIKIVGTSNHQWQIGI